MTPRHKVSRGGFPTVADALLRVSIRAHAWKRRPSRGMTLTEVVFAIVIATVGALAAMLALLHCYRTSDANIRWLSVMSAARAVMEQSLTLDQATLAGPTIPVDIPSDLGGSLTLDTWNDRTDDFANTPGDANDDLAFSLRPEVTTTTEGSGLTFTRIVLKVRWREQSFGQNKLREEALAVLISHVAAY